MFKKNYSLLMLPLIAVSAIFAGCSDDDEAVVSSPAQASVRVIHASYDAPAVDVRVDGGVAVSSLDYGVSSGYAMLNSGTRTIQVSPAGATTPVVIDVDLPLAGNTEYTVFAFGGLSVIEASAVQDNRAAVANKAKVRFVHGSPDAPAVDIKLNSGSGPAVFSNRTFKTVSDYVEVDASSYTFVVTGAGSTSEVVKFDPVAVQNGSVYTVVALGTIDAGDAYPFQVRVFVDNGSGDQYVDLTPAS